MSTTERNDYRKALSALLATVAHNRLIQCLINDIQSVHDTAIQTAIDTQIKQASKRISYQQYIAQHCAELL